ncbi:primase C-terminal domain-containing protein, partial [Proteus mirabilis]
AIRQGWPAYEQWLQACFERARAYNHQFLTPLDEKEVFGVVKSIAKWTHSKFSQESFDEYVKRTHKSDIQSKRGAVGGKIGGKMSKGGGRPTSDLSLDVLAPWEKMNISRRTYFYRKKRNKI